MENLLALVGKVQQTSVLPIFSKEVFIVQNAGMQHWLNMSLASQTGISFNIDYALPAQFLWKLLRSLVFQGDELAQEPFTREALCWRIFELLADDAVLTDTDFASVTQYWQLDDTEQQSLKRYQLSCQLADLYEQYLIFRPQWIDAWQNSTACDESTPSNEFSEQEIWQAKLWRLLTREQSYNPLLLLEQAKDNLAERQNILPKRICLFGLNAMPPMWLSFLNDISQYTQVHIFHFNPCFNYWGDILSEKHAIKQINNWTQEHQLLNESVGNPLLANLGQQGREFLALLQQVSTFNIDAYDELTQSDIDNLSTLEQVQHDILTLSDKRSEPVEHKDDSIIITSAHSALREVQGLHDWLLHQFNQDSDLTPKDILVMCPQVEDYAPYINAVFSRGWQDIASDIPPLPCSIADRKSIDSEPLVIAFSELLTLPDSRFQLSQIIAWLRLNAVQEKFNLAPEDIDKIITWLNSAAVHWGLNVEHKAKVLAVESNKVSEQFTWQYGLSRLMQGFAFADQQSLYQDKLILPDIEGSDAILLGKLLLILEKLQQFMLNLRADRTPTAWHTMLSELASSFFSPHHERFELITKGIDSLLEYCQQADFEQTISLSIVQEFLTSHFGQPDPGRQFMIGQVTFCSMLPMRSIPFKVIAILGLNDGTYPRQRIPFGFDLLSMAKSQLGDRSRRGDDRYLFLEAMISARKALYLSYQGRNIKNNQPKQASIVLKELLDYLHQGYGWQTTEKENADIRQLAMQPFSDENYQGKYAGFDANWHTLNQDNLQKSANQSNDEFQLSIKEQSNQQADLSLTVEQLLRFFQHPSRYFSQHQLLLFLDDNVEQLDDQEPFESDFLSKYLLKEQVLNEYLLSAADKNTHDEQLSSKLAKIKQTAQLCGSFPDLPNVDEELDKLIDDGQQLADFTQAQVGSELHRLSISTVINVEFGGVQQTIRFEGAFNYTDEKIIIVRSSLPKSKDFLSLYITLLLVQCAQAQSENLSDKVQAAIDNITMAEGYFFDSKQQKLVHHTLGLIADAKHSLAELISTFLHGQKTPLLLNSELALKVHKAKKFEQNHFEQYWQDNMQAKGFGSDPYIKYFWRQCPDVDDVKPQLEQNYQDIFNQITQVKR